MSDAAGHHHAAPMITAVAMGYGHLRAAAALADQLGVAIDRADIAPLAGRTERVVWALARRGYHSLSRLSQNGHRARVFGSLLDRLTAIAVDPAPANARPASVHFLDTLVRLGLGAGLGRRLELTSAPLSTTFYANAIAAERHASTPVACVVTDSHVHRIWVPRDPASSRIRYLVPVDGTARCLERYGVAADRILVTGFPLPPELVGRNDDAILERNFSARLSHLRGDETGRPEDRVIHVVVAVGGAGAQVGHVRSLIHELSADLAQGRVRLTLVAGTHSWVAPRFRRWRAAALAPTAPPSAIDVLHAPSFGEYYRRFNRLLATVDILWTKPSELVFYAGLGIPLVLEPPIGDHERHNRALVVGAGAAMDRPADGTISHALRARLAGGWFADAAAKGRQRLSARGARNIARFCSTELYDGFTQA